LLEQIRYDLNLLKDKLEIDIIIKYAGNIRLMTLITVGKNINYNNFNNLVVIYLLLDISYILW